LPGFARITKRAAIAGKRAQKNRPELGPVISFYLFSSIAAEYVAKP
jgi:hypothetical protein